MHLLYYCLVEALVSGQSIAILQAVKCIYSDPFKKMKYSWSGRHEWEYQQYIKRWEGKQPRPMRIELRWTQAHTSALATELITQFSSWDTFQLTQKMGVVSKVAVSAYSSMS
jgi:hypothetical protein